MSRPRLADLPDVPVIGSAAPAEHVELGTVTGERPRSMAAADAAVAGAKPMTGNAYKVQIARTAVKRAILKAAGIKTV